MSKYSNVSAAPRRLVLDRVVIGLPANDSERRCGNECVIKGTFVRSLFDRSRTRNEERFAANSGWNDGRSLFPIFNTLKYGRGRSGTE